MSQTDANAPEATTRRRPSIAGNAIWNFLGLAIPVPVALVAIPYLIGRMGQGRFGVLTIAWALMGYFGVFDFGLSRATTTYLARACDAGDDASARTLFWSSMAAHAGLGLAGGVILALIVPLVEGRLSIEPALRAETRLALYLLAISVPLVVLTSVTRGLLEALHRFDLVNIVKVPASLVTYLGPMVAVAFTPGLPWVVGVILVGRGLVLLTYLAMCFTVLPVVRHVERPRWAPMRPLVQMGGWITVGTFLLPLLVSVDRLVIGMAVSAAAVAAYAAPYEVVTRLWMFSGSLLGVLFPRFAVAADATELRRLFGHGLIALILLTAPITGVVIAMAPAFLTLWLGSDIATLGVPVARCLAVGVLASIVAQVPYTVLQATGHADIVGRIQLVQLPMYALAAYPAARYGGVVGVAALWSLRAALDGMLMFVAQRQRLGDIDRARPARTWASAALVVVVYIVWCWVGPSMLTGNPWMALALTAIAAAACAGLLARALDVDVLEIRGLIRRRA